MTSARFMPEPPASDQESVWSYPRPPVVAPSAEHVRVVHRGAVLADTVQALRVLETAHAPAYYVPLVDVDRSRLRVNDHTSACEFKGWARYADLVIDGTTVTDACWWYEQPAPGYELLAGAICFYPQRVDLCEVDGEAVVPLLSDFYGDWPTSRVVGPFKGNPGTRGW